MTQEDLAKAADLRYRTIVDLERGKAAVELDVIDALGRVFGLPALLWTILPDRWDDKDFEDQLVESVARVGLRKKLDGLSNEQTWAFVMNVSQLPSDEVAVVNRWVLDHLLALQGPQAEFISRRVAEAMKPTARRRRARLGEQISKDREESGDGN